MLLFLNFLICSIIKNTFFFFLELETFASLFILGVLLYIFVFEGKYL